MNIVILDLEWNGSYSRRLKGFINEIIEFGAVKCDEQLRVLDTFSLLVRPLVGKKISSKIENLTSITNERLQEGVQFTQAMSRFKKWLGGDVLLLTWGTSDILTLIENCRYYYGNDTIPFLTDYVDMQRYIEDRTGVGHARQLGLYPAAGLLEIDLTGTAHHNALDDSLLSLKCLKKIYSAETMKPFIEDGRLKRFYDKITFKTSYICDMDHPLVRRSDFMFTCSRCGHRANRREQWKLRNKNFRAAFECPSCGSKFIAQVQLKQKFEGIIIKRKLIPIVEKQSYVRMENMNYSTPAGVGLLTFESLDKVEFVRHGFSTKVGGVSENEFSTMNLVFGRGDPAENVEENYRRICKALDVESSLLVSGHQDHHTEIRRVTAEDGGMGIWKPKFEGSIDGLCTNDPGVTLVVYCADCVPLYFVDPVHRAIGLAHAGWRGTAAGMAKAMIERMKEEFGSDPADLIAAIGPSIGPDHFEVDSPCAEEFLKLAGAEDFVRNDGNGKYHVDLWECNRRFMLDAGIPAEQITVGGVCTMCHDDLLFSHRATQGKRGGMAAFLTIRNVLVDTIVRPSGDDEVPVE